jgi:gliding motility-associated-like protein
MDNNFDKNIRELLQLHTEQPSANCWNKIESQLEALQTTNANSDSSSSPSSSGNGSPFSQFVGSVTGKIVSAVVTVATVGGIVSLVVVNSMNDNTAVQNETATVQNSLSHDENIVQANKVDTFDAKSESKMKDASPTKTIYIHEHKDTTNSQEKESRQIVHPIHIPLETSASPSTMENSREQEIDNTSQSVKKTSPKEQLSAKNDIHTENGFQNDETTPSEPEHPEITIPNIFTPNGDYINDYFVIEGIEQFSETHLLVFRRDGKVIYDKTDYLNDWNADNIPDGVYYYVFKFTCHGSQFMRNGSITIKRN